MLAQQCLGRHLPDADTVQTEVDAWAAARNAARYVKAIFPPRGKTKDDWEIALELSDRLARRGGSAWRWGARGAVGLLRKLGGGLVSVFSRDDSRISQTTCPIIIALSCDEARFCTLSCGNERGLLEGDEGSSGANLLPL